MPHVNIGEHVFFQTTALYFASHIYGSVGYTMPLVGLSLAIALIAMDMTTAAVTAQHGAEVSLTSDTLSTVALTEHSAAIACPTLRGSPPIQIFFSLLVS